MFFTTLIVKPGFALSQYKLKDRMGEIYLILSVLAYWIMEGALLNYLAIALFLILMAVIITRNWILTWIIASFFLLINAYMVLAWLFELAEFSTFDGRAVELLLGGVLILGGNIWSAVNMLTNLARKI